MVDETYVKVASRWTYLYRAVDQHGQVIDVLLSKRRDGAATRAFFSRAMSLGRRPVGATTDRAPVYPRVIDELVSSARHVLEQYATHRSRPWPAQSQTAPDARTQTPRFGAHHRRRARLRAEPTTRPLRARHPRAIGRAGPGRIRGTRVLHLTAVSRLPRSPSSPEPAQRNSAVGGVLGRGLRLHGER